MLKLVMIEKRCKNIRNLYRYLRHDDFIHFHGYCNSFQTTVIKILVNNLFKIP